MAVREKEVRGKPIAPECAFGSNGMKRSGDALSKGLSYVWKDRSGSHDGWVADCTRMRTGVSQSEWWPNEQFSKNERASQLKRECM